jgi:uncharacterized GH25 family protein
MKLLALLAGLIACSPVAAHEFWVQPDAYWLQPSTLGAMTLQVGHGPSRQRSPIPSRRITKFAAITPSGSTIDLRESLRIGDANDSEFALRDPGGYVLLLETDYAYNRLPAQRFNDHVASEGLRLALQERRSSGRLDADGSENYARRAKALVQVGPARDGFQLQMTRALGMELEIVPEVSPYAEPRPAMLPIRVLYRGHRLVGALVKMTNLDDDAEPFATQLTDVAGRATFRMPVSGRWLLNVVWATPLPESATANFETQFASLTFGFPPRTASSAAQ